MFLLDAGNIYQREIKRVFPAGAELKNMRLMWKKKSDKPETVGVKYHQEVAVV